MKKLLFVSVFALAALVLASPSYAALYSRSTTYSTAPGGMAETIVQGTVSSLNDHNKTILIKDSDDGSTYVVGLWAADFATVSKGQNVRVTLEQGSNLATSIR